MCISPSSLGKQLASLARRLTHDVKAPRHENRRSEGRWLATGHVQFGVLNANDRIVRASGNLVELSESGIRFWTKTRLNEGSRFLIMDRDGEERIARVAWASARGGGYLVGAKIFRSEPPKMHEG